MTRNKEGLQILVCKPQRCSIEIAIWLIVASIQIKLSIYSYSRNMLLKMMNVSFYRINVSICFINTLLINAIGFVIDHLFNVLIKKSDPWTQHGHKIFLKLLYSIVGSIHYRWFFLKYCNRSAIVLAFYILYND